MGGPLSPPEVAEPESMGLAGAELEAGAELPEVEAEAESEAEAERETKADTVAVCEVEVRAVPVGRAGPDLGGTGAGDVPPVAGGGGVLLGRGEAEAAGAETTGKL